MRNDETDTSVMLQGSLVRQVIDGIELIRTSLSYTSSRMSGSGGYPLVATSRVLLKEKRAPRLSPREVVLPVATPQSNWLLRSHKTERKYLK